MNSLNIQEALSYKLRRNQEFQKHGLQITFLWHAAKQFSRVIIS